MAAQHVQDIEQAPRHGMTHDDCITCALLVYHAYRWPRCATDQMQCTGTVMSVQLVWKCSTSRALRNDAPYQASGTFRAMKLLFRGSEAVWPSMRKDEDRINECAT